MFTTRTALALIVFGAIAVSAATTLAGTHRAPLALQVIPMGEAEMKGGTTKIGEISPGVIQPNGATSAIGSVCNKMKLKVTDYDFEIKNGDHSGASLELKGLSPIQFDTNGKAHADYQYGKGLEGNPCEDYKITGLKADGSGADLVIRVTPSTSATLAGSLARPIHEPATATAGSSCPAAFSSTRDVLSDLAGRFRALAPKNLAGQALRRFRYAVHE